MDYVANLVLKNDANILSDVIAFDKYAAGANLKIAIVIGIFETNPDRTKALLSYRPKNLSGIKIFKFKSDNYSDAVTEINDFWRKEYGTSRAYSIFNKSQTLNERRVVVLREFLKSGYRMCVTGLNVVSKGKRNYYSCHVIYDYGRNMNCYFFSGEVEVPNTKETENVFLYEGPLYDYNPEEDDLGYIYANQTSYTQSAQIHDLVKESKIKFAINSIPKNQFDGAWAGKKICLAAYFGYWTGYTELAVQTFYCLKRMGFQVQIVSFDGFDSDITTDADIINSIVKPNECDAEILFSIMPPNVAVTFKNIGIDTARFKTKILLSMWETTRIEEKHVSKNNEIYDYLFTTCDWCADTFRNSGIKGQILLLPLGVNEYIYKPKKYENKYFTFITAGRLAHGGIRKGIEDVMRAFYIAFPNDEKVKLKVKIYPEEEISDEISLILKDKRIEVIKKLMRPKEFVEFLGDCHCYVSGSRSEGWGYIQHQAAMLGKPVITVNYSGPKVFLNESDNYFVKHHEEVSSKYIYEETGHWAAYSIEDMAEQMRAAAGNPRLAALKGEMNSVNASRFNFKNYYFSLIKNLNSIETIK